MKDAQIMGGSRSAEEIVSLERLGFRFGDKGAHTSRTIMVEELTSLLRE